MELIKNFGVSPILLAAQIINFLIIFFILKKLLYKPVLDLLKKRRITIQEGIDKADRARLKLEKVVLEEKNILKTAQMQAKKIIEDARKESIEVTKQLSDNAKKQTEKMLIDAKDQIIRETAETEKRLAVSTSKLAISFLEKALSEFFSLKEQKEVVSSALKKIKKINPAKRGKLNL